MAPVSPTRGRARNSGGHSARRRVSVSSAGPSRFIAVSWGQQLDLPRAGFGLRIAQAVVDVITARLPKLDHGGRHMVGQIVRRAGNGLTLIVFQALQQAF